MKLSSLVILMASFMMSLAQSSRLSPKKTKQAFSPTLKLAPWADIAGIDGPKSPAGSKAWDLYGVWFDQVISLPTTEPVFLQQIRSIHDFWNFIELPVFVDTNRVDFFIFKAGVDANFAELSRLKGFITQYVVHDKTSDGPLGDSENCRGFDDLIDEILNGAGHAVACTTICISFQRKFDKTLVQFWTGVKDPKMTRVRSNDNIIAHLPSEFANTIPQPFVKSISKYSSDISTKSIQRHRRQRNTPKMSLSDSSSDSDGSEPAPKIPTHCSTNRIDGVSYADVMKLPQGETLENHSSVLNEAEDESVSVEKNSTDSEDLNRFSPLEVDYTSFFGYFPSGKLITSPLDSISPPTQRLQADTTSDSSLNSSPSRDASFQTQNLPSGSPSSVSSSQSKSSKHSLLDRTEKDFEVFVSNELIDMKLEAGAFENSLKALLTETSQAPSTSRIFRYLIAAFSQEYFADEDSASFLRNREDSRLAQYTKKI